ncbi:MAG: glycosyltransferase, partial [Clostridia bacterium]|nr:glycosyltransferase [Clostridia bacterium]
MKILFVHPNIGYGGASKMLTSIANHYVEQGHDVEILTFTNDILRQKLNERIKHTHIDCNLKKRPILGRIQLINSLHKYIKTHEFDFSFAFLSPAITILPVASVGTKTKVILSERGCPGQGKGMRSKMINMLLNLFPPKACVFQTSFAQDLSTKALKKNGVVINNAAVKNEYWGQYNYDERINDDTKIIVNIGRLDLVQKRQDIFIRAIYELRKETNIPFRAKLVGDGEDGKILYDLARELRVDDIIEFCGYQKNIYPYL